MNSTELEGKWNQVKGDFKQKYGKHFNDDKSFADGKMDEVIGKIQEKTGKTKEAIKEEIEKW